MRRGRRILGLSVLVLALTGCKPSGNGQADGGAASGAAAPEIPLKNWCTKGVDSLLGRWQTGSSQLAVSYCLADSTDAMGVTHYSRLDVRQDDLGADSVVWKIHEEVGKGLTNIVFFRPSFAMLDVDGNGTLETFFGYQIVSDGMEPVGIKFMAHMDGKKYAIRGQVPRNSDDEAPDSVQYQFDPAFTGAPARLTTVADSLFRKFVAACCLDSVAGPKFLAGVSQVNTVASAPGPVGEWTLKGAKGVCTPGVWVDGAPFTEAETADPQLINESESDQGVRIRWTWHTGRDCRWVGTNQGMSSPDGPYWVSQVQSEQAGTCVAGQYCIGQKLAGIVGDTELTFSRPGKGLTVTVRAGKVAMLDLGSENPPAKKR